ncbi:hypothetical protein LTR95_009499 [Oleoguttula sp. CCFEE 5521]
MSFTKYDTIAMVDRKYHAGGRELRATKSPQVAAGTNPDGTFTRAGSQLVTSFYARRPGDLSDHEVQNVERMNHHRFVLAD